MGTKMKLTGSLKVLCMLMFCVLFINMASALEFDNVKDYDPISREVTITNSFGLGAEIGKARLNTPLNVRVGLGYQKVAEFDIWAYQDYSDALKQFTFEDMKKGREKINRDYDLKYLTYEDIIKNDYKIICSSDVWDNRLYPENPNCEKVFIGTHTEKKEKWVKITPADLKKNEKLTIGVFTNVQEGDYVDWIPSIYGVQIDEWATWTADLNVDLISYWAFDETSGTVAEDEHGTDNLTTNATVNAGGKIGTSYQYTSSGLWSISNGNFPYASTGSINYWVYLDSTANAQTQQVDKADGFGGLNIQVFSGKLYAKVNSGDFLISTTSPSASTWYMITLTWDGSNERLYINGLNEVNRTDGASTSASVLFLGMAEGGTSKLHGRMDEMGIWNSALTPAEVIQLYNGGTGITYVPTDTDNPPTITLNSPSSANFTTPQTITANFTAYDDVNLSDVKFYVNEVLNQTNASGINNTDYLFEITVADGDYTIYGKATDNASQETSSSSFRVVIDTIEPFITSSNITNLSTFSLPVNSSWDLDASDTHIDDCYYNTTENSTFVVVPCNSTVVTSWNVEGDQSIQFCANDTFGNENCTTENIYISYINVNQFESDDPVGEGMDVTWNLTVGLLDTTTTTANFNLNGTSYAPNVTTPTQNQTFFEITLNIPDGWGNSTGITYDWYWNYTIDGILNETNTSTQTITVFDLALDDCSSYTDVILNMSLKDEELLSFVNESLGATVEVDAYITSIDDPTLQLHYFNTFTDKNNPQVCMPSGLLNNSEYWIDFTIGFDSTDHVWEFYYLDSGILNSTKIFDVQTTSQIDLFDLLTTDSTSFLFNYFDQDGLPVDDAIVHVYRRYIGSGNFKEVERAKADLNGDTIVHLVEEDVIYYFVISQYGEILFTSSQYTALCQSTPCTIQIEASGDSASFDNDWDLIDGGAYNIQDDAGSRLVNMTYSLNDTSTMNVTVFKYASDGSYSPVVSGSDTGSSGSILLTVPQGAGNVSFFATVYQDGEFKNSEWVNFEEKAQDRMGITLALFLSALIILTLGLMAITEGVGTLVFVILGVALSGFLGLMTTELSTGVNIVVYLVVAGGILLYKLTGGRR